jgi:ParB-like chromosome segregation protein Spo0J
MSSEPEQTVVTEAVPVATIGERLAAVRLLPPRDLDMAASLRRFGQLSPLVVFRVGDRLEVIDGFRRLRAATAQRYPEELTVQRLEVDEAAALAALFALHRGSSRLCELEEGWVVQTLIRRHRLAQAEVAQQLRRHPSWVSRRLLLVEALAPEGQEDMRLGLCSPTAAREVARLPRGMQRAVASAVMAHRLSTREAAKLCATIERLGIKSAAEVERLAGAAPPARRLPTSRSEAEQVLADLGIVEQVAHRLAGRLSRHPGLTAEATLAPRLATVRPVLVALLAALGPAPRVA